MGVLFVLVSLASGFIFTRWHIPARFVHKRTDGWDSYFHLASWGAILGLLSAFICMFLDHFNVGSTLLSFFGISLYDVRNLSVSLDNLRIGAWITITIVLSLAFGYISHKYYEAKPERKLSLIAKISQLDHLDSFILESSIAQFPVMINMKSRKVYVGYCYSESGYVDGAGEYIAVLPLLSGYRNQHDLSIIFTSNYYKYYKESGIWDKTHKSLDIDKFRTIIPKSEIDTYSYFDFDIYENYNKNSIDYTDTQ